jgi:hypothetical protein
MGKFWRRRTPRLDPDAVRPDLLAWAQVLDVSRLSERTVQQIEEYLRTYRRMAEFPREELAFRLVRVIRTEVSPRAMLETCGSAGKGCTFPVTK